MKHHYTVRLFSFFAILSMLFSAVGIPVQNVLAADNPTPPAAPVDLIAAAGDSQVDLTWTANSEIDLAGYNIYRDVTSPVPLVDPINGSTPVSAPAYTDAGLTNDVQYFYVVTAVNASGLESLPSNEVSVMPSGASVTAFSSAPIEAGSSDGPAGTALQFNGSTQYATLGTAAQLRSATFTVELWFKRTGAGIASTNGTGTSGIANPIPLITKGRAEAETAAADVNYFFGIDATSGKLVADFEEAQLAQGGTTPGLNHPITGTAVIAADSTWHHAAATYDGATWNLYLDGVLDGTLAVNRPANALTNALTSVGSARTTAGAASGYFAGVVDEVRVWNVSAQSGPDQRNQDHRDHRPPGESTGRLESQRWQWHQPGRWLRKQHHGCDDRRSVLGGRFPHP